MTREQWIEEARLRLVSILESAEYYTAQKQITGEEYAVEAVLLKNESDFLNFAVNAVLKDRPVSPILVVSPN